MYYFDKCVPFGCSISCNLFNRFADFLEFMVKRKSHSNNLMHYLDDFFGGGKPKTDECLQLMEFFSQCMCQLNVPLAEEKTEGPVTRICFAGLENDSEAMLVRLPKSKIQDILINLNALLHKDRCTLKDMQSLIGSLNFACRAIIPGRPFCRRLINSTCGLTKSYHNLRIIKGIKNDLVMWKKNFEKFNGIKVFHDRFWSSNEDVQLFTDSALGRGLGFGIFFAGKWVSEKMGRRLA